MTTDRPAAAGGYSPTARIVAACTGFVKAFAATAAGAFEGYFRAMVALLAAGGRPDPAAVRALQAQYDTLPVGEPGR